MEEKAILEFKARLYNSSLFAKKIPVQGSLYQIDSYLKRFQYIYFFSRVVAYIIMLFVVMWIYQSIWTTQMLIVTFLLFIIISIVHYFISIKLTPDSIIDHFKRIDN